MAEQRDYSVWGWERFFGEMETFLTRADRDINSTSTGYAQFVIERLDICVHAVISTLHDHVLGEDTLELRTILAQVRDSCMLLRSIWYTRLDQLDAYISENSEGYHAPQVAGRVGRGRPQLLISQDQLEYLRSLNFSWTEIGKVLSVSRMTIYRRRRDFGMLGVHSAARSVSDADLRTHLKQLRREFPNMGETLVIGRLRCWDMQSLGKECAMQSMLLIPLIQL